MLLSTPIIQIVDLDPVSLDVRAKVSAAVEILSGGRFHHLPIVNRRKLVGMLTATDIVGLSSAMRNGFEGASASFIDRNYALRDLMVEDPITISDRATIAEAASKLSAGGFHCLPIVDHSYDLVGVVTTTDLVSFILSAAAPEQASTAASARVHALEAVLEAAQIFLRSGLDQSELQHLEAAVGAARAATAA